MEDRERVEVTSRQQWRDWLQEHAGRSPGVWCVTHHKAEGGVHVPYEDVVRECLAVGWVDSMIRGVDERRSRLLCTPRKPGSGWSRPNQRRVAELEAQGRMTPAGRAVVDAAQADGSWTVLDDVEDLVVPDDLAAAFEAVPGSRERYEEFSRSQKRGLLEWLVQAKTAPTREKRLRATAEAAARGEVANAWHGRRPPRSHPSSHPS